MVLVGYEDTFSFYGEFDYNMFCVKDGKVDCLTDVFEYVSLDNFVDRRESYESVVANIENKDNLKDIFKYKANVTNKATKSIKLVITYYDKKFEKHIPFLIERYQQYHKAFKDINLIFEYAPHDEVCIKKNEFVEFLKEKYEMLDDSIKELINSLKGEEK